MGWRKFFCCGSTNEAKPTQKPTLVTNKSKVKSKATPILPRKPSADTQVDSPKLTAEQRNQAFFERMKSKAELYGTHYSQEAAAAPDTSRRTSLQKKALQEATLRSKALEEKIRYENELKDGKPNSGNKDTPLPGEVSCDTPPITTQSFTTGDIKHNASVAATAQSGTPITTGRGTRSFESPHFGSKIPPDNLQTVLRL